MIKLFITLLFFLNCFALALNAQAKADLDFQIALKLYDNLQFNEALAKFERISKSPQSNSSVELSSLFYAKSLLHLSRFKEAENHLKHFIELFPNGKYADEARLTLGKVYLEQGNFKNSFRELIMLADNTEEHFYKDYSKTSAAKIAASHLNADDIKNVLSATTSKEIKPFVQLQIGKAYLREHNNKNAEAAFLELLQLYPDADEKEEAQLLYAKILTLESNLENSSANNSLIGVILPLSNNRNSAAAKEILEGIKFAVSEFNKERTDKIGLLIKDTELHDERISEIKNELENISSLKAIIGPIFSGEVKYALDEFKDERIAIISPTATDNDLTDMYENFFQANPSFPVRGKIMAQYIYFVENKRSMAVLNALEGYSHVLAAAFVEEFEKLGGRISTRETYKSNSFNLEKPISNLAANLSDAEGIYIPLADKADAPVILSQLGQSGVDLPIYGNQDWIYAKGLEASPLLSNQLTFTSDYFIDYNSFEFQEFSENYFRQTKTDVSRNVLYGFDTAKYLLTVLRNFAGSRDAVKLQIQSGIISDGFHNNICFDEQRINKFLNIVRYKDGKFELIDEFKVNN